MDVPWLRIRNGTAFFPADPESVRLLERPHPFKLPQRNSPMSSTSKLVSIHPYFRPHPGNLDAFKALAHRFVEQTSSEPGAVYYEFTINGGDVFCREAYVNGEAALAHLDNVAALLAEALTLAELVRLEFHGPASELDKLRGPLSALNAHWFVWECGINR